MENLLKNLAENLSKECFNEIINITESIINEIKKEDVNKVDSTLHQRQISSWVEGDLEKQDKANKDVDKFMKLKQKWLLAKNTGKIKSSKKDDKDE